ncbi:EAL domain-containing protein [Neobacillus sp. SM06]|uniref:EAL domain-containing protein n=1 Tax=Neobacillus sp. SM06 TaxID=3422492 RepID=UPI003D2B20E1
MVRHYIDQFNSKLKWLKLVYPWSSIKFFPPQFILRDPVVEGVKAAFQENHEAAVIVFTIKNIKELTAYFPRYMNDLKKYFQMSVQQGVPVEDIIALHDYYSEGITLLVKVHDDRRGISQIDVLINTIMEIVKQKLAVQYTAIPIQLETGYMFIERKLDSLSDAVARAYKQATEMAEKKVKSGFNEMLYLLRKLVSEKDIKLLAQPIIDVATNEIRAWEILTRGPSGTVLENPLSLFSIARQTGLLYELEMIVIEKALEQMTEAKCQHDVFVNCTPLTLGNIRFVQDLKKIMARYKTILPTQITFEVTERDSIEELKDFSYTIKLLRVMGFRIAVDDTGAGYASLNTISEILPEIIKIDRSVIENIDKNTVKESMLKGLLLVAKEAGSLVVAEGIESEAEASVLSRHNVDLAQGYFYARPASLIQSMAT